MIRPIREQDREFYLKAANNFYQSDAVLSPIPFQHIINTFDLLMAGTPFAKAYILEKDNLPCGYALLAETWSQEAGGAVIWIEELYVLPEYRGHGLGHEFFSFLEKTYQNHAKRFRLEVEDENKGAVRLYKRMNFDFFPYKQMKKEF